MTASLLLSAFISPGAGGLSRFVPHAWGTRGVAGIPGPVSRQIRGCECVQRGGATNATVTAGGAPRPCHRKSMLVCAHR